MTRNLADILLNNQEIFQPVVPFDKRKDRLYALDLTADNKELSDVMLGDCRLFSLCLEEKLKQTGARYAIGGYNEHRTVYALHKVFDAANAGEQPRRLHLGTDIWGKPGTAVMAPLDGIVHSFANNDRKGDYGATIILSHQLDGVPFYTLYGHLGLSSIRNLEEGRRIMAGEIFAAFGIPAENGQWSPHLHFQLIVNLGDWYGDYPGVCAFPDREKWLSNSPDPDLILRMNSFIIH